MKEYLQLEGLVYKLVPIRTPLNSDNPYIMGRLDSDSMYDIVMQMELGKFREYFQFITIPKLEKIAFPLEVIWLDWLKSLLMKVKIKKLRKFLIWQFRKCLWTISVTTAWLFHDRYLL